MSIHNPSGRNQYRPALKEDDPNLQEALKRYHAERVTNNEDIAARLKAEHGIEMSAHTVKRRRMALGLKGSRATTKELNLADRERLVLAELDKDPALRQGVRTVMYKVAHNAGVHVSRDFISQVMHDHNAASFEQRQPYAKKILRFPKHPIGPNERWASDGHDKTKAIGFPIYAFLDDATSKYLGVYVVPDNRNANIVTYCYLDIVEKVGGIPLQVSTDCGSETTKLYGVTTALRERFRPDLDNEILPAHVYVRSVNNITAERGWVRMRYDFTDNAIVFYKAGVDNGRFDPGDEKQSELCRWLWAFLMKQEAEDFVRFRNGVRMRKMNNKPGPSGMSRNEAYSIPEKWGGRNCLIPVDLSLIREMKEQLGGPAIMEFSSADFSKHARTVYDTLHISKLSFENVWDVFDAMYTRLYL